MIRITIEHLDEFEEDTEIYVTDKYILIAEDSEGAIQSANVDLPFLTFCSALLQAKVERDLREMVEKE